MQIKAAVARAVGAPLSFETLSIEEPRDTEILVRVVATGICHTDIAMRDQTYPVPQPIVLGHEGAGIVEKVGRSVTKVVPGDHVVMSFNFCERCPNCREQQPHYCEKYFDQNFAGAREDGSSPLSHGDEKVHGNFFGQSSFATHALCHQRNVVKVRPDIPLKLLGPLACGIQTGAGAVINSLQVGPGRSIAIFGLGTVGLSAVMAARLVGAVTIVGIDVHDNRLSLASELGATHVINAAREDCVAAVMKITGRGVNFSFDSTGVAKVIRQAMDVLAHRGACGIVGASKLGTEITLDAMHLMTAGRSIQGIVEGDAIPEIFIPQLIDLHLQGKFPFDRLVRFYDFEEINQAIEDTEAGRVIKPVICFAAG